MCLATAQYCSYGHGLTVDLYEHAVMIMCDSDEGPVPDHVIVHVLYN